MTNVVDFSKMRENMKKVGAFGTPPAETAEVPSYKTRERKSFVYEEPFNVLDESAMLTIKTRSPGKYILIDLEYGQVYRGTKPDPDKPEVNTSWRHCSSPTAMVECRSVLRSRLSGYSKDRSEVISVLKSVSQFELASGTGYVMLHVQSGNVGHVEVAKFCSATATNHAPEPARGHKLGSTLTVICEDGELHSLLINESGGISSGSDSVRAYDATIPDSVVYADPRYWYELVPEK